MIKVLRNIKQKCLILKPDKGQGIDAVSMGSPLGPVLGNIIMTKLESTIAEELVDKSLVKLYLKYVEDILLLVKDKDINHIHKRLNSFD